MDFISTLVLSPELKTSLLAMLPVGELRVSIPVGVGVYHLSALEAYIWSVIGNILPIIFLLLGLGPASDFLRRNSSVFEKFFGWLFERTRRNYSKRFQVLGSLALISLVAVPLPFSGAWTAAIVAFVFGIPFRKALLLIFVGVLIAGGIVTGVTLQIVKKSALFELMSS